MEVRQVVGAQSSQGSWLAEEFSQSKALALMMRAYPRGEAQDVNTYRWGTVVWALKVQGRHPCGSHTNMETYKVREDTGQGKRDGGEECPEAEGPSGNSRELRH